MPDAQMPSFLRIAADKARQRAKAAQAALKQPDAPEPVKADVSQTILADLTDNGTLHDTLAPPESPVMPTKQPKKAPAKAKATQAPSAMKSPPDHAIEALDVAKSQLLVLAQMDSIQVLNLARAASTNADAFEIFAPHIPAIVATIVSGAMLKGAPGHQDRMTVFRMLGAPWTPTSNLRGEGAQQVEALSERFLRAVSRVERKLVGRNPVTVDADYTLEPASQAENAA